MNGLRGMAWLLVFQSIGEVLSRGLSLPTKPGAIHGRFKERSSSKNGPLSLAKESFASRGRSDAVVHMPVENIQC